MTKVAAKVATKLTILLTVFIRYMMHFTSIQIECAQPKNQPHEHAIIGHCNAKKPHEIWIQRSHRYHHLYTRFFFCLHLFCLIFDCFCTSRLMSIRTISLVPAWHFFFALWAQSLVPWLRQNDRTLTPHCYFVERKNKNRISAKECNSCLALHVALLNIRSS